MIHIINGDITFADTGQCIKARMEKSSFLSSPLKSKIIRDNSHSTASIYMLDPMKIWNEFFHVMIIFDQSDKLYMVHLFNYEGKVKSWDSWTEAHEKELKVNNDAFLEKHIGNPPYIYDWGVIKSVYDTKGGSSSIIIKYN